MSKRIKRNGKYWSIDFEADDTVIFLFGVLIGIFIGNL